MHITGDMPIVEQSLADEVVSDVPIEVASQVKEEVANDVATIHDESEFDAQAGPSIISL